MRACLCFLSLTAALLCATVARAESYLCKVQNGRANAGLGENLFIGVDEGTGRAAAANETILHFNGRPLDAVVTRNNDRTLQLSFSLTGAVTVGGDTIPRLDYRVALQKQRMTFTITVRAPGFNTRTHGGSGTCRRVKENWPATLDPALQADHLRRITYASITRGMTHGFRTS